MKTCLDITDDNSACTRAGAMWYALDLLLEAQDWAGDEAEVFVERAIELLTC